MDSEYTLRRPLVTFPPDATVLAYEFSELLITTLNQDCLVAHLGWSTDPATPGPWHALGGGDERALVVSLVVGVYSLWTTGDLDVAVRRASLDTHDAFLVATDRRSAAIPPLEANLRELVQAHRRLRPRALVEHLPLPSKQRGLGAWFFTGPPTERAQAREGWFARASTFTSEAPSRVRQALELAATLVVIESGADADGSERDAREEALFVVKTELFGAVRDLP